MLLCFYFIQTTTTSTTFPTTSTSTSSADELCRDTLNFLDMYGGSCEDYALPANVEWCGVYGNDGEAGNTPNDHCCVCKALVLSISKKKKKKKKKKTPF